MSSETHLPPLELPNGTKTKVRWSKNPEGKLLVFVHGFNGAAVDTWAGFPEQLCLQNETRGYDLTFFGYDSVTQKTAESISDLYTFLDELLVRNTVRVANRSILDFGDPDFRRESDFTYRELVLVGHSLGACIVRRAVLRHIQQRGKGYWPTQGGWPIQTKMVWFAPAHHGAWPLNLVVAVALKIRVGPGLLKGIQIISPVLKDLHPGSQFLKDLLADTKTYCKDNTQLNATKTFWAWRDWVVENDFFAGDSDPDRIKGVGHISISKPTGYQKTVRQLLAQL